MKVLELFAGTRSIGRAPRGARTGTQGLKNHVERSRIPDGLCNYIVQICEDGMNYKKFFEKAGD